MAFDKFLIAPIDYGLETGKEAWMISDDAFAELKNAYLFRGRVRKRFGSRYMSSDGQVGSRLRVPLKNATGTTDGAGDAIGNVSTNYGGNVFKPGQMFSIGDQIFTVYQSGDMLKPAGVTTATFNTTTGAYVFAGATALTQIYFYPSEPVMGLKNYETGTINNQPVYAWDTRFAYYNNGTAWTRSRNAAVDSPILHGDNTNFVWMTNWRGAPGNVVVLFASNFHVISLNGPGSANNDDPIWWMTTGGGAAAVWKSSFDHTSALPTTDSWFFAPPVAGADPTDPTTMGPYIKTARIIVPFKGRLLLLNTVENNNPGGAVGTNSHYGNRFRYSINGSPFARNAWYEPKRTDIAGNLAVGAGWLDAPTTEEIISAEFIKDRLVVYFEHSTWEIAYTGNAIKPFVWQQLNSELGSQAQQSSVPFDKVVLTVGNTGIHACNGYNVERVDKKIPNQVFQIKNKNEGVTRVAGIRDYYNEMVYWSFPSTEDKDEFVYPTEVLVYNYVNDSWAINEDCITAFGYFEQQSDVTWESTQLTWAEYDATWRSGVLTAKFRQIVAGNQEGFVYIVDATVDSNEGVMQLSNIELGVPGENLARLTIRDHTVSVGNYIRLKEHNGLTITHVSTGLAGNPYYEVVGIDITNHIVDIDMEKDIITGTYTGGGTVARVSQPKIKTKQFNPYADKGKNVYLAEVNFCVKKTTAGELRIDYFNSFANDFSMIDQAEASGTALGTNVLETYPYETVSFEALQDKLWHVVYFQASGENVQLYISMSDEQMRTPAIVNSPIQIEGMILSTQPIGHLE